MGLPEYLYGAGKKTGRVVVEQHQMVDAKSRQLLCACGSRATYTDDADSQVTERSLYRRAERTHLSVIYGISVADRAVIDTKALSDHRYVVDLVPDVQIDPADDGFFGQNKGATQPSGDARPEKWNQPFLFLVVLTGKVREPSRVRMGEHNGESFVAGELRHLR
jgi:hypothetical protein